MKVVLMEMMEKLKRVGRKRGHGSALTLSKEVCMPRAWVLALWRLRGQPGGLLFPCGPVAGHKLQVTFCVRTRRGSGLPQGCHGKLPHTR